MKDLNLDCSNLRMNLETAEENFRNEEKICDANTKKLKETDKEL